MSLNPLIPAKPATITLDTLPQLFAHNRARFGGWTMTQAPAEPDPTPPERPEDVTEDEWAALGDPGKAAIDRMKRRATEAERSLAAARAKPAPPVKVDPPSPPVKPEDEKPKPGEQPDIAAIVKQAVEAAVKPFQDAEERRTTEGAAEKIRDAVMEAAKARLHDATDALIGIDLTKVVNDQGQADPDKIKTELDSLVTRKPHLAKSLERVAPPGIGGGIPAGATDAEKVKAVLADMQRATGVRNQVSSTN